MASKPYSSSDPGGMATYIDKFQAYIAELETINPMEYSDYRKKRTLLSNIRHAEGVAHLIQKCRDDKGMTYDQCAAYLRENALYIDKVNQTKAPSRLMFVQDMDPEPEPVGKSAEDVLTLFHTMAESSSIHHVYKMFNTKTVRESLSIPEAIWSELEPMIKVKITEIRAKVRDKRKEKEQAKLKSEKIPNQYPSMKNRESVINMVSTLTNLGMEDVDDDTDDDMITSSAFMARTYSVSQYPASDIPGEDPNLSQNAETSQDVVVKAHFEYTLLPEFQSTVYAISDGGADSCILGKMAKVISYTGKYASLVGYDPRTTGTAKFPIVSAYIKVRSSSIGNYPVLLKVNDAPINPDSPVTLLSEYQI
jgi:hypothetical protein